MDNEMAILIKDGRKSNFLGAYLVDIMREAGKFKMTIARRQEAGVVGRRGNDIAKRMQLISKGLQFFIISVWFDRFY